MITETRPMTDKIDRLPSQHEADPNNWSFAVLSSDEIQISIARGRALRAEHTGIALAATRQFVSTLPERLGNWLKSGHASAGNAH